jgi:predicted dehydrogenase
MENKKLKVGIAGYGVVAKRRRYYIDQHPNFQTVAICDQLFTEPGSIREGVRAYSNYHQLLEEPLDVLIVCLPNYLAPEVTIAGLEKGMHVFCEKPPGRTISDIKRVIEVEKKHPGLLLKYGFNHRYHESVKEALQIIKSNVYGEVVNVQGEYGKSRIIPYSGGWRSERKIAGGGILLDQGIHMVDLMRLFCGEFIEVKSFVSNNYWNHDVEDNAFALMKDKKGRIASLHSSATLWQHKFSLQVTMKEGCLQLSGILSGTRSYGEEKLIVVKRNDESDLGSFHEDVIRYIEDNSWHDEVYEFADAIINNKPILYGSSAEALATMYLVYKIYYADPVWREKYNIECPD